MIKTLQKRFVLTAMAAITLLLFVLLGIINIFNAWYLNKESNRILNMLSNVEPISHHHIPPTPKEGRRFFSPPPEGDTRLSALYFTVREDGEETSVNLNRISSVTEEQALNLVSRVSEKNTKDGNLNNFKYKILVDKTNTKTYIFLDTSTQRYAALRIAGLSLLTGFFAWMIMLLIVILLSKKAIRPIAENIEKQKQFVTDAGHEIKTPLAIIMANTEAMELRSGESKWSRNIKTQISRLDGLMKDLLTLARSDEPNTNIPLEEINLSNIVDEYVDMFRESAELRKVNISRNVPTDICIISNSEYVTRIISTLFDNAVKYSKTESTIYVSATHNEKTTELHIKNDCEELPVCTPEKLFDRFYREDSARTQKTGGYGIGLSAARAIAVMLGGSVSAKYEGTSSIIFTVKF